MSDIFESKAGSEEGQNRPCRVAYTINNEQPVKCTIVSDQPLFYMDYEFDEHEDDFYDDMDSSVLEKELKDLKTEIEAFDRFSKNFLKNDNSFEKFSENVQGICAQFNASTSAKKFDIQDIIEVTAQSRLGASYINATLEDGFEIMHCNQVDDSFYHSTSKKILINPSLDEGDQILTLSRELRRHYQSKTGALLQPLLFAPDEAVLVNRALQADLMASTIRIAWELQLSGRRDIWERVENSSFADLGHAFAREAFLDFRNINNGIAATAVFESWFLSRRAQITDKKLIQNMLSDHNGMVFDFWKYGKNFRVALDYRAG